MASPDLSPAAEELPSTVIDDLHYSLQAEQKNTQKRTFTSWVNSQLEKHSPPSVISDLYADIGQGNILLDLLEVLSGQQLTREKGSNTFQCRSNIEHALTFLKNRSIKLINIHVADIIEGKPSIVLGLIWNIILHFHIEELTWILTCGYGHHPEDGPSVVGTSPTANPPSKTNTTVKERWKMSAKKALLLWAKEQCAMHGSISVADFKSSWRNGLAFLAVIHALRPDLVDMESAKGRSNKENLKEAFDIAEKELKIPRLLEPEDVDVVSPDEKSIMTYVSQFLQYFKSLPVTEEEMKGKVSETLSWLHAQEEKFEKLLTEMENESFCQKFQEMLSFMETFNEEKKAFLPVLASKRNAAELSDDYPRIREAWDSLTSQMNEWKAKLDSSLPPPLDVIESWLQETELQLAEDLPDSHDHSKAVAILEGKVGSLQSLMECSERHLGTLQSFQNRDEEGLPLVPPQKLEEMRRRLSNVQLVDFNILVEYQHSVCSAILEELTLKLNIWLIKYGTKESVQLLLSDWQVFVEEKGFLAQLETIFQVCEEKKNKIINSSHLGADPQDVSKLFIMVESKICRCREYICNVNATLRKVLSSWKIYMEYISLLKAWLEETRKAHPKKISTETLAVWNSRHGTLNEAGNFLIESSNEEVGSAVSAELKKLNRKWAKLIKKTQFEMRLQRMQEGGMKLMTDSNGNFKSPTADPLGHTVNTLEETLKALPVSLRADSLSRGKEPVSEQEVKLNFEEAQKVLETSVLKAMQLLGQETHPEGPVSKYEEAFSILDAKILGEFLKGAEQLKAILPAREKAMVEEKSKDVCERWKAVRHEIVSYIQLKMEMEKGKLNNIFSKLNKQLNKEKKLLSMGKTKGLIEEHEATFSKQGRLNELNTCLQVLKSMSEKMSEEEKQLGTKISVEEYEKKREELQAAASAVYRALVIQADAGHSSDKAGLALASANGDKASALNPCDSFSAKWGPKDDSGKHLEAELKFQNGNHCAEKTRSDGDLPLKALKESYHTAKHNLKLHLHSVRETVASGFADDPKDAWCLQNKLHQLETLENKGDSSWRQFESTALKLEKFASESEKPVVSDKAREELLKEWNMLRLALSERIASLKAVLEVVSTVENEWLRLHTLNEQLHKREIPQCVLTNTDRAFKRLTEMRKSVANCIEQCNRLEQGSLAGGKIVPIDRQAADAVIAEYRVLLEELGHKMQVIETILQDLETFLAFLRRFKKSVTSSGDASASQSPPQQEALQEISLMKKEAESLDKRLKQVNIDLEDAECGPKMCFEKMVAALDVKDKPAGGSVEEQKATQTCEAQEEFVWENSELLKNIQDIHDKISKIGLRDPTIPAVQQRSKSLNELRQKLDRLVADLRSLKELANQLLILTGVKGEEINQQLKDTEDLWKTTKHSIAERQEHCARVIELLKQYHSCKSCLASIIQKQEHALSQQASYMGKDNLQRIIANVSMVKSEFSNHSEDVDRINQICKNLQIQLNKMKSFEEPPFENEANAIVDRWLDINERTENYCDNLGRALALWDKLLNFSSVIDGWLNAELKKVDNQRLTEEELAELEVGLRFQEENLEEFDRKVDEIQGLLNGTEPPLELQVIKSSLLNKMELIRKHLSNKSIPAELNGNTAELKGDLDLAKTQIGMTESLLKALSPSDTLEIFTKLEEIHQKILQQKGHVKMLQKETGCLSPEVVELKKQLKSVTDLFNSKKQIFQDHFTTLLNYQCEDFNDWFNSTQLSLKGCFDPSETKEELEEKIQQLLSFLTFEGKDNDICEVKTLLTKVKSYLPKANVNQLSSWVRDQEAELQKLTSRCQTREKELCTFSKRFIRLEEDFSSLEEWLRLQEEKLQKSQMKKAERAQFYRLLLKQRESVDSLAWLTDSLKKSGFGSDQMVQESAQLVSRYKVLLNHIQKSLGASQVRSAEEKNFEELAQSMLSWVQRLKELVLGLSSEEPKTPVEERLQQVKEIISLKEEGDAKLQNIVALGEHLKSDDDGNKNLATQQMVSDIRNQWECTIHLAAEYLRHQEQLQLQREQDRQREGNLRAVLGDLGKQKQEFSLALQPGSQETQSQLSNDAELLREVEGLTFLLNELRGWQNSLGDCTDSTSAEESLVTLQHLHECLLHQLQIITKLLSAYAEEQIQCEKLMMCLRATLKEISKPMNTAQKQVQKSPLFQTQDTLQEIRALVESVKQKTLPLECRLMKKDEVDIPKPKPRKRLKHHVGPVEKETGNVQNNILKFSDEMQTPATGNGMTETGKPESSYVPLAAEKISFVDLPEGVQKRRSEKPHRMKIKTDREAPKLFQEWLISGEQLSSMSAESEERSASGFEGSEMEIVSQTVLEHEGQIPSEYTEMERKVDKVKTQAAELDIVLMNNQLREIENLCAQLEEEKAKASLLCQELPAAVAEISKSSLPDPCGVVSSWDGLLKDLKAMKEVKQDQCHLVNNYQECLSAVQSSMKRLSVEKENIKMRGPMQVTVLLENTEKCLASVQKERILLNKLKAEQENLSRHLTSMDKELTQSQVKQVEQWWEQIKDFLQRKRLRVAAETDEFKCLMEKAQDLQKLLQQQHCLQTGLGAPNGETQMHLALLATELQTLKHRLSLLKRDIEMRIKRLWSDPDKKTLESEINDLQSQVEELEQLTPREQVLITGCHPQAYEIARRAEEAILWVRVLVLHLDEKPALFPDDLASQIKNCQATINAIEKKEPDLTQLADEAQQIALQLESNEASTLRSLSRELQTCYRDLVLKIAQRLQELESYLEKRQKLFADLEKIETQLRSVERTSNPDTSEASLKSELDHWQAILEEISKVIQEMEALIDTSYKGSSQGLNIFEQLFLNDYLRSLRNRAKRAHRLTQIKCCTVKNKMDACAKLSEKITALQQELKDLQCNELKLDTEKLLRIDREVEDQLRALKERTLAIQSSLLFLHKYKEIWECQDLKWDVSCFEEFQSQLGKIKKSLELRVKSFDDVAAEYDRCQIALSKAEAIITTIQKDCDALEDGLGSDSESSLLSAKSLSQKLQLARYLVQEAFSLLDKNEAFGASLKEAKTKQLKSLEGKIDGLAQMTQNKILALQAQYRLDEGFQRRLDPNLQALKQIESQLQQPLLVDLEIHMAPYEKMYCRVLEDVVEAESRAAEALINEERGALGEKSALTDDLGKELEEVQKLEIQLKTVIAARRSALDEACEIIELYNEAVQKAADLLDQCKAHLSSPLLSLDELEDAGQLSYAKQEEFEAAKAEVEALTSTLEHKIKPEAKAQLEKTLSDLGAKSLIVRKQVQKRISDVQSCLEIYQNFTKSREKIRTDLHRVEKMLWKALCHTPVSYKEALEQLEQSKMLTSQLVSTEEDLKKLRQSLGHLNLLCREKDCVLMDTIVSTLWLKWLSLLEVAKEWESKCEEQNQEWKSVNEEMERETIILDNLQEEVSENPKEREGATKEELQEFLECTNYCEESVNAEKLLLRLILHRIRSILNVPECPPREGRELPLMSEIQAMQDRLKELSQKAQNQKDAVLSEIQDRAKTSDEIDALKKSLQDTISLLHDLSLEALTEKSGKLEEIQRVMDSQKQALEQIMDKLRMKYSEMYTIVPVEIETHLEDCKQTLQDLEEKVSTEALKNSPHYTTDKKIEDINKGLQAVENMLQQKTENIARAKEIQQRIWDLLDLWHYKMNELDSEVQDMVEQDPCQGQELMDRLMVPLQQYQQVSRRAERRTADINRASSKIEECDELLKSTQVWLENTGRLLTEEAKSDTAKALNKHADALQMALEDSEQKQSILSAIYPELEEFSTLIKTENKVQELNDMNEQVTALQQKIMGILPHIQHLADEVEAIECGVKTMEKDIDKIKTILSPSEDTLDFSPKEHLKHGQVILAHISPMQKGLAEIQSYKERLRLPDVRLQPFSVFQRTKQLLKELKTLEKITKEQNKLLEPIAKEVEESEHEIEALKQVLKSHLDKLSTETPLPAQADSYPEDERMEKIKRQIDQLCQRKEDILTTMKNSLLELHQRQEESESDDDILESQVPEESRSGSEWQLKKRGSLSLLPSLVEEAEDSSFHSEGESSAPVTNTAEGSWRALGDSKETVDPERPTPEAAQVLHVCQAQVAELELWLDQTKESLRSAAQTHQMQQGLEKHLAECQLMLLEIEQKVISLLENCKDSHSSDHLGLQGEAESLSLKLTDVKRNLEKVQGMLQDKNTEQLNSDENISEKPLKIPHFTLSSAFPFTTSDRLLLRSSNGLQQQQELLLKLSEQSNLIEFIDVYVDNIQPRSGDSTILDLQASPEPSISGSEPHGPIPSDPTGDKWQHLLEELLFKMNLPHCQFAKPQIATKINILPKGASSSVRTPTVEELKTYTAQLGSLSQAASVQIQENMAGEISFNLDQKLFELLLAISRCLSNMEQMLNTCVLTSEEAPVQQVLYETLSAELQTLHKDVGDKKVDLLKSITLAGGNAETLSQCFSSLQAWLQLTQAAAASRSKSMKMELDHHSNYQNEIRLLYDVLIEKKSRLQQSISAMGRDNFPKHLQSIDAFEVELQNFELQAAKLRDRGERLNLPVAIVHEVYKLEDVLDDLWGILRAKQKELTTPSVADHQHEALLRELEELVSIGQEKVAQVPKLKPTSRQNLEFLLQNHKDFFQNLHDHMLATQMCSKRVAPSFLQKKETFWNELVEKVKALEEQAVQHGTRLERLLQDWIKFNETCGSFVQKLETASSAVPSVGLVEETEERLLERTGILQQIKRSTEEEQARYHQLMAEGKKVMALVSCPELQSQVGKLEEQWQSLCTKVDLELQRLETMLRLLSSYNRDSRELEKWLESAQQRINDWKEQSLSASQDLDTVRSNICNLLAFSKEVDDRSSLKSSVISTGNQLLLIKACDAAILRSFLTELEQKWADLIAQLPSIQEKFHQLQMAKLPSHEAITELTAWMDHVDQQRRNEAAVSPQSPLCQVKDLLKKYREYLMEMNFKQWTVDYVNQSLLQMSTCDVESKRYERTVFAERLGEMNLQWHRLQGSLNEKIKELEHILESVAENENRAQSLSSWLEAQSSRLKLMQKPASLIDAQERVEDCKALENQLAIKSADVDQLKQNYTASLDCAGASEEMASRIKELDEMRTRVGNQVSQLKTSTLSALEKWRIYDEAWEEVRLMLARALYCMEHTKPLVVTVETLRSQVENLQSLQDKAESSEESWAGLQATAADLKKLCDPSCSEIIDQKYKEAHRRWTQMIEEMGDQFKKAQTSLNLLESYVGLNAEMTAELDKYEEQCKSLLVANIPASHTMDFLKQKLQDVQKLQLGLRNIERRFPKISELADKIAELTEPAAQSLLLEKLQPLQRISSLKKMLQMKADEFQSELLQLEDFESCLDKLEKCVKESTEVLDSLSQRDEDSDQLLNQALGLTALSPEMESLNEVSFKLPLSDFTAKRLQDLNWQWTQRTAMSLERCSELQGVQSDEKKFLQKCQNWVQFLEKAKEDLKEEVPGTLQKLWEQQRQYEILQAEISVNQQIFNNILSKALHLLESGEAENRTEFISKLTLLKEQWQSVIQMSQQRKAEIDGLVKQWQKFKSLLQDVTKFLMDTDSFVAAVKSREKYSLHQARNLSHDLKNKEILLQRWQTRYSLTLDIGKTLLDLAEPEAKTVIQVEMTQLQEKWDHTQRQVEKVTKQLQSTIEMWESCEKQIEDLGHKLQELKARIEDPLPTEDDDLHAAKEHVKELEKSLNNWDQNLKELGSMKADLAHFILAEDMLVLKEQVAHLHRQWEELCLRVSLRKQEIEDRLNTWIVFNEKNKELCAWLVQMESKVLQSADVSIEDMIEKLQKDCMEEINLFSENKLAHLKQMGEQLIKASSKSRVTEIEEKLNKIDSRWQHLFDVIGGRVKKLKETFAFIQQLDKNMSNLRTWLARIESELSKPVVYDICDDQEIQKRLAEQQDLQRDIEQHSAGVESVFNICEVLLHDSDACANETECDSIQQTTRSLDRRWRNICAMSMERRMKIEETWRLWQKFLDDYSRFEDWLKMAERTAAYPNSSEVSYTNAKEELKKFEAFQRQIHERLTQLELINKQYRRLARENRTDSASKLKQMVHEGNQRWDNLQKRVAAILRRLKHFTNQWEEFVGTKDSILVWLTEMDLQLTNVEHFSESNLDDKMRQLNGFQQEITLNTNKIDQLIVFGENLIQKCEPSDAVVIEEELEELHKYCQDVFGRVSRFHQRLTFWHPVLEDEKESSENEADTEDARGVQNDPWHNKAMQEVPPSQQSLCHLVPPAVGHERSGCETPVSIDSIPLEWDHTGDVGGSSSHEDEEEEPYFSALSEITENPEAYLKMTTKALKAASGKSTSDSHTWHSPDSSICRKHPYNEGEEVCGNRDVLSSSPETSTPYKPGYVKQLSNSSVGGMKEMSGILLREEAQDSQTLAGIASVKKQPGVIESHRWDLIQAQDLSNKLRMKQNLQQWQQLNSDLTNISAWLDKMEGELQELQEAEPASSIQVLEQRVKKLKDMLKAFDNYKALVLSVNLTSKDFKQADSTESKELQNRLRRVNLRWEKANLLMGNWRKSLQEALMHCQDFHELNQKLLLWLAGAETRRHQAQVKDQNADPHTIQEIRKELMQLEKELLEKQLQVNTLQEISTHLLVRSHGGDYAEADEKVHVIGKKLKQLLEGVSHDLKVSQGRQDISAFLPGTDELNSEGYHQLPENPCVYTDKAAGRKTLGNASNISTEDRDEAHPVAPKTRSFFYRVLRAALPLQLLFLLLLLLASMIPSSEEDYSCTQANNFARSFYPMLRYTNGPPPT
ncbi:nesprin-2 isoform X2 [Tiliqua scincoides]|uniref:nesprin-2 isoform X2 n=1 Tax=Tiliqua scincoides TaxID=71010 RepID=UPI003461F470